MLVDKVPSITVPMEIPPPLHQNPTLEPSALKPRSTRSSFVVEEYRIVGIDCWVRSVVREDQEGLHRRYRMNRGMLEMRGMERGSRCWGEAQVRNSVTSKARN